MDRDRKPARVVTARVLSQRGTCHAGHAVGDAVTFRGDGVEGRICIHALYAMLPKVFAMRYNADFPWLENPAIATFACPDAANPVVFELRAEGEDGE